MISADSDLRSSVRLVRSATSRSPSVWASRLAFASRSASCLAKSVRMVACSRMMRSSSPCRRDSTARIWPPNRMSRTLSRLSGAASLGGGGSAGRAAGAGGVSFRPFSARWFSVLAMLGNLTSGGRIGRRSGQGTAGVEGGKQAGQQRHQPLGDALLQPSPFSRSCCNAAKLRRVLADGPTADG